MPLHDTVLGAPVFSSSQEGSDSRGEIILYESEGGSATLEVLLESETLWLSQRLMAELFDKDSDTISLHLSNIYKDGELLEERTTEYFSVVQTEGSRKVKRKIKMYNLDAILSVGYRVNSKRGTQFRIWASGVLRDFLVRGYSLNERKLAAEREKFDDLTQMLRLIDEAKDKNRLSGDEEYGLLKVLRDYAKSLLILTRYDNGTLGQGRVTTPVTYEIEYEEALHAITRLREQIERDDEPADLFGIEKEQSFSGILKTILQTFGGQLLYPSIEEQAAHLLYFIIKDHPFVDGNKRIGAFMFVLFLEKNKHLFTDGGKRKIDENAFISLTLLVAASDPQQKELMINLIITMINW